MHEIVRALSPFVRRAARARGARCEVCAAPIGEAHRHVVERASRTLLCACGACATLFVDPTEHARFRAVPDRVLSDPRASWTEADWAALGVPVGLAFVRLDGARAPTASYPSPAGPVESEVPLEAWRALAERSALVRALAPEVEALLVRRPRGGALEAYLAPIDACFELVGAVRAAWRGIEGGDEVQRVIAERFDALRARSAPISPRGEP